MHLILPMFSAMLIKETEVCTRLNHKLNKKMFLLISLNNTDLLVLNMSLFTYFFHLARVLAVILTLCHFEEPYLLIN